MSEQKMPHPTGWRILVKKHTAKTMTSGGIALPDDIVKGQDYVGYVGEVIELGPEAYKHEKFGGADPWCDEGDTVFFNPHAGMDIRVRGDDAVEVYRLLNDDEILGFIGDGSVVVRYDV